MGMLEGTVIMLLDLDVCPDVPDVPGTEMKRMSMIGFDWLWSATT